MASPSILEALAAAAAKLVFGRTIAAELTNFGETTGVRSTGERAPFTGGVMALLKPEPERDTSRSFWRAKRSCSKRSSISFSFAEEASTGLSRTCY